MYGYQLSTHSRGRRKIHRPPPGRATWLAASAALIAIIAMLIRPDAAGAGETSTECLRCMSRAFADVAKSAFPAVVFIRVEKQVIVPAGSGGNIPLDMFGDELFRRFFGDQFRGGQIPESKRMIQGQGSGFIISSDGYVLTNNHVVEDADKVTVKLGDGHEFEARIIGTDPHTDLAVLKVEGDNLPVLPLGDSDALEVGDWVVALGNPFGLSQTLTTGVVSAKGRNNIGLADYEDFIQTDAAINPGNSGGPLIDLDGKAIGINTAIFSRSGGSMGIGFAIPINMAKPIRDQLIAHGSVSRGYLGIVIQELTPDLAATLGVSGEQGILISDVTPGSPAEKAGLKRGDVIVGLDSDPVDAIAPFRNRIALLEPGTDVELTVSRSDKEKTVHVTIGELHEPAELAQSGGSREPGSYQKLGLSVEDLTRDLAQRFGYVGDSGVLVTGVDEGSMAAAAGIKPGTLIREVDRQPVSDVQEFRDAIDHWGGKGNLLLLIKEGGYSHYVVLKSK